MTFARHLRGAVVCALPVLLAACQAPAPSRETQPVIPPATAGATALSPAMADAARRAQGPSTDDRSHIYKGTGVVVRGQQPGGGMPPGPQVQKGGSGIVLNFEGADLREVVRNILGDILNENYTIDPSVGGTVTIRTSSGIPRDALPATLETLLRLNGATMVKSAGLYQIVPQAVAVRGNVTPAARQFDAVAAVRAFRCRSCRCATSACARCCAARALREGCAGGAPRRAAQHAHSRRYRARAATPDGHDRDVRHRLDGGHVGRRVHAAELRRQVGDAGTREALGGPQHESVHRHPQDRADRADERAAGRVAAACVPRGGEEVDRSPRHRAARAADSISTSTTCRTRARNGWRRCCSRRSPDA